MIEVDYIVVGQGLAGSAIAMNLLKRNKTIAVYDDPAANNSSTIAAGLFNPITGKKMVKTWLADKLFPFINNYYTEVERVTGKSFFYPMPIYRPFISIEEQNEWMARSADPAFIPFIEKIHTTETFPGIRDNFGGLLLKQSGWLDTKRYIEAVGIQIRQSGTLIQKPFEVEKITLGKEGVSYGNIFAKKIIFCMGIHKDRWFDWLPIRSLKGETLTISNDITEKVVVNRGIYMIPQPMANTWRVGSTYNLSDTTAGPTTVARAELEEKIKLLTSVPFEVLEQVVGFRPTTPDRRPIIGAHPSESRLLIFNGLGTKGVSLAPYFSEVFVHALETGGHVNKEVDIERFKSLYSGSPK